MLATGFVVSVAQAATETYIDPGDDYAKHLRSAREVTPLKSDAFGEQVSLYNGSTEFMLTDIAIPGNFSLPVQLGRQFQIEGRKIDSGNLGGFGEWDLDVPYIVGTFTADFGWKVLTANGYDRCTHPVVPDVAVYGTSDPSTNYQPFYDLIWDGNHLHVPGDGDQEMFVDNAAQFPAMTDGNAHPWITKSLYRIGCLAMTKNGYPGEAFVAVSPSGVKYTFDWVVVHPETAVPLYTTSDANNIKTTHYATRSRIFMLATRVEDRFGNWVSYTYSGDHLTHIDGYSRDGTPDGRFIALTYTNGVVTQATSNVGTWTYSYITNTVWPYINGLSLSAVTSPDGSQWTYSATGNLQLTRPPKDDYTYPTIHCQIEPDPKTGTFALTIGAPSGATSVFSFSYDRHWRNYVAYTCNDGNANHDYPKTYAFFDNFDLIAKEVSGPGAPSQHWSYSYLDPTGSYFDASAPYASAYVTSQTFIPPGTCNGCSLSRTTTVVGPTESTSYSFGAQYARNEGRLLGTSVSTLTGTVLKSASTGYVTDAEIGTLPFPDNTGLTLMPIFKSPLVSRLRPVRSSSTVQDGVTFTATNNSYDALANPLSVTHASSLGFTRSDATAYVHNTAKWVINQVNTVTDSGTGKVMSQTNYDAISALPIQQYQFGLFRQSMLYNTDGTLASVTDGNGHTTTASNWFRGVPRLITFADTTTQSAVVNDAGWLTSVADENGFATSYGYDVMGRLTQVTYPSGDSTVWNNSTQSFTKIATSEYGIPAGHWKLVSATGRGQTATIYDALWRPVVTITEDLDNAASQSFVVNRYDAGGRLAFASYPVGSLVTVNDVLDGTATAYDALGRVTSVQQNSELGVLTTTTEYLTGFQTRVTNPRGYQTTMSYQAFDAPSTEAPTAIVSPEAVTTTINRDTFGKPLTVTRTGVSP